MDEGNGLLAGFITNTKTVLYVVLESSVTSTPKAIDGESDFDVEEDAESHQGGGPLKSEHQTKQRPPNDKVFITHGKNHSIVEQLKEILKFGKFEPVVAVDHETTSKPVPDKVLEDMRACFAYVIHVESEQQLLTVSGDKVERINENVLIEI